MRQARRLFTCEARRLVVWRQVDQNVVGWSVTHEKG
jgi:hypothetical protein